MEEINVYLQKVAMKKTTKDTWGAYGRATIGSLAGGALGQSLHAAHPVAGIVGGTVGGQVGAALGYGSKVKNIAAQHGKKISNTEATKEGIKTSLKSQGRAVAEGVGGGGVGAAIGGAIGAGVGALKGHVADGARMGAAAGAIAGGVGGVIHGGVKSLNNSVKKYHDKYASEENKIIMEKFAGIVGLASKIIGAGKAAGGAILRDAKALPGQLKQTKNTFKVGTGLPVVAGSNPRTGAVKGLLRNRAVQAGAGAIGTVGLASKMRKDA